MTNPTLIAHAKRRADILNASAAWGACDDGMLIQQLVARIEKLEAQLIPTAGNKEQG